MPGFWPSTQPYINMEYRPISQQLTDTDSARPEILAGVNEILEETLQLGGRSRGFTEATPLLGEIPELDSMAVLTVLTTMEEHFGIVVDDDDVSAETFETVGNLVSLVVEKTA